MKPRPGRTGGPHSGRVRSRRLHGPALAALLVFVAVDFAQAEPVEGLYTIRRELDASADNPRRDAIRRGFERVLTRITGSRTAPFDPELQQLTANAESGFMSTYAQLGGGLVEISYIESEVESALRRLNWPVWGRERPTTLLWVAIDNGFGDRALLSDGQATAQYEHSASMAEVIEFMRAEIATVADERGLVFELPRLDLQDLALIDYADVWGRYEDVVTAASSRYAPDTVVLARVRNSPIGMDVEWALLDSLDRRSLVGAGFREGLDWLADQYAAEFGLVGGTRLLTMEVEGVMDEFDYGRVMSYLDTIDAIESHDLMLFDRGLIRLSIASRGDSDQLRRVFGLDDVLVPIAGGSRQTTAGALRFEVARPANRP